jgi:hypothetical protein
LACCVSVALQVCWFQGFVLGHTGTFVRRSCVAILFWCFGFVCSFRNWQCDALFYCIFLLFCVYLVSLMLGFFSLTFHTPPNSSEKDLGKKILGLFLILTSNTHMSKKKIQKKKLYSQFWRCNVITLL